MNTRKLLTPCVLGLGLALALVWLLGASLVTAAPAATFNVDTLADGADGECSVDCTLREAIIAANGNTGADVISLTVVGTYELTITGTGESWAATGDLDIRDEITILGQGPGATVIDANGIDRVFYIQSEASTVVISGVTIMGGAPPSGGGGGISANGVDLSLINVAVISNSGTAYGGGGGGIRLQGSSSSLTIDGNCILARNEAYGGGGVAVVEGARASLTAGRIVSNSAILGGGVYVYQSRVTLNGVNIFSNTSSSSGGGVYIQTGSATLDAGQITSNTTATNGGGAYVAGTFTQTGGTIGHNSAGQRGGGLHVQDGVATLNGGQIVSNTTTGMGDNSYGGGGVHLYLGGATLVQNSGSTIADNSTATHGGGVYLASGHAILNGGQILSNTAAESGGGVYLYNDPAALTQTAGLIAFNIAQGSDVDDGGGGIYGYLDGVQVTLHGGQILGNQARSGGGVHVQSGSFDLTGGRIISNTAEWYGGGVYAGATGWPAYFYGGRIVSNSAEYGGGLYGVAGDVKLERGQVISNTAAYGGGVYHTGGASSMLTLVNTTVSGNHANNGGGALHNASGTMVLTFTTIASNTASSGFGIDKGADLSILAKNTIIAYNSPWNCVSGAISSRGHNIASDTTCNLSVPSGDQPNVDPELPPLALDHGTLVHAIDRDSPAYNAGACQAGITRDQRGLPRLNPCDVGAYEYVHAQVNLPLVLRDS